MFIYLVDTENFGLITLAIVGGLILGVCLVVLGWRSRRCSGVTTCVSASRAGTRLDDRRDHAVSDTYS